MDEEIKGNADIEKALKDFNMKSTEDAKQKSPDVSKSSEIPKMVSLVIKFSGGVVKNQKQAEYILLSFVLVAIAISVYLIFGINGSTNQTVFPIYQEDLTPTARATISPEILKTIPFRNAK